MWAWKSEGLFDKSLKPAASNNSFAAALNYINTTIRTKFDGSCLLKQKGNIDLVYEITLWPSTVGQDFLLRNSLFGCVKSSRNTADFDKCKHSGNGIGSDAHRSFSLSYGSEFGKNVILGADLSSSVQVDNRKKRS